MDILTIVSMVVLVVWMKFYTDRKLRRHEKKLRLIECKINLLLDKFDIDADLDPVREVVKAAEALRRQGKGKEAEALLRRDLLDAQEIQQAMMMEKSKRVAT